MFERISHIGIVVHDIDAALRIWCDGLGFKPFAEAHFDVEGIRTVFLSLSGHPGEMAIELMQPPDETDMTNAVARRLATKGEGFYHLALVTDDVVASGETLRARSFALLDRPPVDAASRGRWLITPKTANGVMIEGTEEWSARS